MSFADYEHRFISIASFVADLHLVDIMLANMFEDRLNSRIKGMVSVKRLKKFKDRVEATLIAERN